MSRLSNQIFWMTLHTLTLHIPLTVVERYRYSHDVFPDGSGKCANEWKRDCSF